MNKNSSKKSEAYKKIGIGAAIVVVIAVIILLLLRSCGTPADDPGGIEFDPSATAGGWDEADLDAIRDSLNEKVEEGMINICTPVSEAEAKPGDLVFFEYTYEGPWITHVGIYVGDGHMIHAGSPIGYLKFMDSYYKDNFVGFGRLPAV